MSRTGRRRRPPPGSTAARAVRRREPGRARAFLEERGFLPGGWVGPFLTTVVAAELIGIVVFGCLSVFRFPVWAPIDEGAHYSYIQQVAEHADLPVLGHTYASQAVMAISSHADPATFHADPTRLGLAGLSYEAFQPPLYYVLAAPVFDAVPGYLHKVYAVRFFDMVLTLVAAVLAWVLCREAAGPRAPPVYALTLVTLLIPGVLVRSVTISNQALVLPVTLGFLILFLRAWRDPRLPRILALGAVLGACLLTQILLVALVPLFLVVAARWLRAGGGGNRAAAGGALALPLVILAPWLAFNAAHYHSLTADALAVRLQSPVVNPGHVHFSIGYLLPHTVTSVWEVFLPQEWSAGLAAHPHPTVDGIRQIVDVLLIPFVGLVILAGGRRVLARSRSLLALPYPVGVLILWWITYGQQWDVLLGRYTYFALPGLAVVGAEATREAGSEALLNTVAAGTAGLTLVAWVVLAAAFL